jgi:quercetin dioxygenase-like cupin family protein
MNLMFDYYGTSGTERDGMEVIDLKGKQEFSSTHHIQFSLAESPLCGISIACWEPGQISPIHCHPEADEIYHVLEGEALFRDGRTEHRLKAGGTVFFRVGEIHQVQSLTRMVLYRVQAGADRRHDAFAAWPPM